MVSKDVVFAKISQIKNCLKRIQAVTKGHPDALDDLDVQDVFVLNLQRAVQTALDLASHIVADENLGLPESLKDNFLLLKQNKIITPKLCEALCRMVGFRNIAVHDYSKIEIEVLKSILQKNLGELEEFYAQILKFYHLD